MIFTRRHPGSGHPLFRGHLFVPPTRTPFLSSPPSRVSHFKRVRAPKRDGRRPYIRTRRSIPRGDPFTLFPSRVPLSGRRDVREGRRDSKWTDGGRSSANRRFFTPRKCLYYYYTYRCLPYVDALLPRVPPPTIGERERRGTKL